MFEKEAEIYALSNFGFRGKHSERVLTAKIDYQYGAEFGYNKANKELQKAKQIIQEFLDLNYSEFIKTNAVFLHADKFLKESK